MTIHSSLRGVNNLVGERSVLTRKERIAKLQKDGKFDPAQSKVWGLQKVRTKFKVAGVKKAPKADAAAGAAPAAAGGKPAAKDAKPAKK